MMKRLLFMGLIGFTIYLAVGRNQAEEKPDFDVSDTARPAATKEVSESERSAPTKEVKLSDRQTLKLVSQIFRLIADTLGEAGSN